MRRVLIALLAAVSVTALTGAASPADVDDVPTLTPGVFVTGTVTPPNRFVTFKAPVKMGQHVSIDISKSTFAAGQGNLLISQKGSSLKTCPAVAGSCEFTPNDPGRYDVVVAGRPRERGSLTFAMARDQNNGMLELGGDAHTAKINYRGQQAIYALNLPEKQLVAIHVSAADWGSGGSAVFHLLCRSSGFRDLIPFPILDVPGPTGGLAIESQRADFCYFILDPDGDARGTTTFSYDGPYEVPSAVGVRASRTAHLS